MGTLSFAGIFNLLQDATIVAIAGETPGTVRLEIDCDYLRDRLEGPGDRFFLSLNDCTRFVYRRLDDDGGGLDDINAIAARRLWISGADQHEGFCVVHCAEHMRNGSGGKLEIAAHNITISIDNGREIPRSELEDIAEEYWSGVRSREQPT